MSTDFAPSTPRGLGAALAASLLTALPAVGQTVGRAVSAAGDLNVTGYINPIDPNATPAGTPFGSLADGFQIFQRGVSASIPFSLNDDSAGSFAADGVGIIQTGDTAPFFGATDTENGDNTGPVSAQFVFDVRSATGPLTVSADLAAFGDFEAADTFSISYAFGADALTPLFTAAFRDTGEEEGTASAPGAGDGTPTGFSAVTYTLESGTVVTLDDPLAVDGIDLSNAFAAFASSPLAVTADTLTVAITAQLDGSSEAVALRNLTVTAVPEPATAAATGLGALALLRRRRQA